MHNGYCTMICLHSTKKNGKKKGKGIVMSKFSLSFLGLQHDYTHCLFLWQITFNCCNYRGVNSLHVNDCKLYTKSHRNGWLLIKHHFSASSVDHCGLSFSIVPSSLCCHTHMCSWNVHHYGTHDTQVILCCLFIQRQEEPLQLQWGRCGSTDAERSFRLAQYRISHVCVCVHVCVFPPYWECEKAHILVQSGIVIIIQWRI